MTTSGRKTDLAGLSAQQDSPYTPDALLDELERAGYGNVDRDKIPANWRDVPRKNRAPVDRLDVAILAEDSSKDAGVVESWKENRLEAHAKEMRTRPKKKAKVYKPNFTIDKNQERRRAEYLREVGRKEPKL